AQRHFGHGGGDRDERLECLGVFDAGAEIFRDEISAAPVVGRPSGLQSERAGERTFVEGNASDDADIVSAAGGEKFVFGILIEDVVDDLNGINEAGLHGADSVPWFPAVHADADSMDFTAGAKLLDGADGALVIEPFVFPGVVLNQVEGLDADIAQAFVHVFENVFWWIGNVESELALRRPAAVLRRHFAGDVEFFAGIGAQGFAEELFAVAVAVGPGSVKKIAAEIDRTVERGERFGVVGAGPASHAPHAVADFADLPVGTA